MEHLSIKGIVAIIVAFIVVYAVCALILYFSEKKSFRDKKTKSVKWGKLLLSSLGFTFGVFAMYFFFFSQGKISE